MKMDLDERINKNAQSDPPEAKEPETSLTKESEQATKVEAPTISDQKKKKNPHTKRKAAALSKTYLEDDESIVSFLQSEPTFKEWKSMTVPPPEPVKTEEEKENEQRIAEKIAALGAEWIKHEDRLREEEAERSRNEPKKP